VDEEPIRETGRRMLATLLGDDFADQVAASAAGEEVGANMSAYVLDSCFGTVWTRPGLELKQRSIATIAILMALRQPEELKNHFRAGLNLGLTVPELEELVLHCTAYLGFPANGPAMRALKDVLAKNGYGPR